MIIFVLYIYTFLRDFRVQFNGYIVYLTFTTRIFPKYTAICKHITCHSPQWRTYGLTSPPRRQNYKVLSFFNLNFK